jgi:hypothetical protein
MNDIDYQDKYLKYKNKYLELKKHRGGYLFYPKIGETVVVKIYKEPLLAYCVRCAGNRPIWEPAQILIRGKKKNGNECSDKGWVVDQSLIKNRKYIFDSTRQNIVEWLDTSKLPEFDDDDDNQNEEKIDNKYKNKIKMYMWNKDKQIMYDANKKMLCNSGTLPICIKDGETVYDTNGKAVNNKNGKPVNNNVYNKSRTQRLYNKDDMHLYYDGELIKSDKVIGNYIFEDDKPLGNLINSEAICTFSDKMINP